MSSRKRDQRKAGAARPEATARRKRPYEKPRLVDYGTVSKLTQTGGLTFGDGGGQMRVCL